MEKHGKYGALVAALLLAGPAHADCGLALALIIDVSGSVSNDEFALQMQGTADALLDPQIAEAILAEQAALTLIQWSGARKQKVMVDWAEMHDIAALQRFAAQVAASQREWANFSTALGSALAFTGAHFDTAPDCDHKVIDVSGDGQANEGLPVAPERARLVAAGFRINGIAIENGNSRLVEYFRQNVIGGTGAFVLRAQDFEDYPRAIRRKLINEVTRPAS